MKRSKEIIFSEPVQEIMGTPPRRLIALGTTILFIIFIMFILASVYIRYPDLIPAQIEITTRIPPATLNAKNTGRIEALLKADREEAEEGEVIAVMESAADWRMIIEIESFVTVEILTGSGSPEEFPASLNLGEIQASYTRFIRSYKRWYSSIQNDHLLQRIESLKTEVRSLELYIGQLRSKENLLKRDVSLESERFRRDSLMHSGGVIADSEYERSLQALLNRKMDMQNVGLEIMGKQIEREKRLQEIQELLLVRRDELQEMESAVSGAHSDLRADIALWKKSYLFIAPFKGTISYTRYWSSNQHVNEGDPVITVIPAVQGDYVGRMVVGPWKSGKVSIGMPVNIKLSGFPYLEYGLLKGVVSSVSMMPDDRNYIIETVLPEGLVTTYGVNLDFTHNMPGTAEIISENMSLISRIVAPLRHLMALQRR